MPAARHRPTSASLVAGGEDLGTGLHLARLWRRRAGLVSELHDRPAHPTASQDVEVAMFGTPVRPAARS
jgi:hypothetical protein